MGDSRVKDVSSLLSSFFDEEKLRRGERYSEFFAYWPSVVGSRLAAHSRVADVDKGLLVVEADHPGWIQLLQFRQSVIVEEVARRFPELGLRGIVFRLAGTGPRAAEAASGDPGAGPPAPEAPGEAAPTGDAASATTVESAESADSGPSPASSIEDPAFKALFADLKRAMRGKD